MQLCRDRQTVSIDVLLILQGEPALIPAVPQSKAECVLTGMQQFGDIVGDDLHPGTIIVAVWCQKFPPHTHAIQLRSIQTGAANVKPCAAGYRRKRKTLLNADRRQIFIDAYPCGLPWLLHLSGFKPGRSLRLLPCVGLGRDSETVARSRRQYNGQRIAGFYLRQNAAVINGKTTLFLLDHKPYASLRFAAAVCQLIADTDRRGEREAKRACDMIDLNV